MSRFKNAHRNDAPQCTESPCRRRVPMVWENMPQDGTAIWQECDRCNEYVCTSHSEMNECGERVCHSCMETEARRSTQ
jgi:hypothetical protein